MSQKVIGKFRHPEIHCDRCGSNDVHLHGKLILKHRQARERYDCNNCGKSFTVERDNKKLSWYSRRIVRFAIDQYNAGDSSYKIAKNLFAIHNLSICPPTIIRWVREAGFSIRKNTEHKKCPGCGSRTNHNYSCLIHKALVYDREISYLEQLPISAKIQAGRS